MRHAAVCVFASASLLLGAWTSDAATVDLSLVRYGDTWNLDVRANSFVTVQSITLVQSNSLGLFHPNTPPVCSDCVYLDLPLPDDENFFHLNGVGFGPLVSGVTYVDTFLGWFGPSTASASQVVLRGAEPELGYAVVDPYGNPIDYSISIVPEPALPALAWLAASLLAALLRSLARGSLT